VPVSNGPALATIWDADLLIWAVSQLVEAHDRRLCVSPVLTVSGFQVLRFLGRGTGQTQYRQLAAALDRLAGSAVETSIGASPAAPARFCWIERWDRTDGGLTIVMPDWLLVAVIERRRVLRIDPAYLRLTGGIARWLWRLLRRHAHEKSTGWEISLLALYTRSGSLARPSDFVADLRRIARANALPGYRLSLVRRAGEERLRAAQSAEPIPSAAIVPGDNTGIHPQKGGPGCGSAR
jgi:plasmid replication initiation protein